MQVTLNWASVPNALYYRVYRAPVSGGPYNLIGQSNPNPAQTATATNIVTTYIDGPNNLPNGQNMYYVVSTVTQDGESAYSTEIAALWPGAPSAPVPQTAVVV